MKNYHSIVALLLIATASFAADVQQEKVITISKDDPKNVVVVQDRKIVAEVTLRKDGNLKRYGVDEANSAADSKAKHIAEAQEMYPVIPFPADATNAEREQAANNRKARLDYLSQFLTPDEMINYRMQQDGNADSIAAFLKDLHPSDDEFKKAFSVLDGQPLSSTNGQIRADLEVGLREALGETRYEEFRSTMAPENIIFARFVDHLTLTPDELDRLKSLRNSFTSKTDQYQAVSEILKDPQLVRRYFADSHLYVRTTGRQ